MKLEIVNFKQAKALMKLGFPQLSADYSYSASGDELVRAVDDEDYMISAPSLELAAKWLREEKKLPIIIDVVSKSNIVTEYWWKIFDGSKGFIPMSEPIYKKYEDALSDAIDKAIKILNKK